MAGGIAGLQAAQPLGDMFQGQYKANQLGAAPTLGNQQAQDHYRQLAEAFVMQQRAAQEQEQAKALQDSGWINNSGGLGVLEQVVKAYTSKKLAKRADEKDTEARERYYRGEAAAKDAEARREAEKDAAERERRQGVAGLMGLSAREALEFAETGKVPQAVRNVPMMTDQGLVNVNPYSGEYAPVQPQGAPEQVSVYGDVPPAVAAAIKANPAAFEAGQQFETAGGTINPGGHQATRPLMPYRDPAEAQRQAAADARANAQLGLAYRAAERADKSLEVQQQAARNKPVTEDQSKSAGYALRMERALESIDKSAKTNPGADRPGFGIAAIDALPESIGNYLKPAERQNIEAAQLDALDAALTLNTGAAYTKEQLFGLRKAYFPQPGDDESTILAKKERLGGLIDTARIRARQAYPGQGTGSPAPSAPSASGNRVRIKL